MLRIVSYFKSSQFFPFQEPPFVNFRVRALFAGEDPFVACITWRFTIPFIFKLSFAPGHISHLGSAVIFSLVLLCLHCRWFPIKATCFHVTRTCLTQDSLSSSDWDSHSFSLTQDFFFIGPESDHWLCLSVTPSLPNSLTDSLLFSKLDWCDPGVWRYQLKTCWGCYCC